MPQKGLAFICVAGQISKHLNGPAQGDRRSCLRQNEMQQYRDCSLLQQHSLALFVEGQVHKDCENIIGELSWECVSLPQDVAQELDPALGRDCLARSCRVGRVEQGRDHLLQKLGIEVVLLGRFEQDQDAAGFHDLRLVHWTVATDVPDQHGPQLLHLKVVEELQHHFHGHLDRPLLCQYLAVGIQAQQVHEKPKTVKYKEHVVRVLVHSSHCHLNGP
mmetsp:Transcript_24302/g.43902  ORF Transcript_24302/g.43902 Transcript_24302/m.43902 type:complete len:218 (+) Transcript_24302:1062-1715(+)